MLFEKIIVSPLCTASICLSVTLLAAGLAAQIAAALVPNIILPALDIPTLAALSLPRAGPGGDPLWGEPPVLGNLADRGHCGVRRALSVRRQCADGAGRAAGQGSWAALCS